MNKDINTILKSNYKNYLKDGLKIYFSRNRPIKEVLNNLNISNAFILKEDNRFLLSYDIIKIDNLKKYELKEYDFNFMNLKDNTIVLDIYTIFDINCLNLKEILNKDITINDIKTYFKNWNNVKDIFNNYNKCLIDLKEVA